MGEEALCGPPYTVGLYSPTMQLHPLLVNGRIAEIGKTIPLHSSSRELSNPVRGYCMCVVGTHRMLLSICRTCIQVQFDVSASQSAPHLDDLFLHRERRELESGAPAALGEGAFAGTRLVRRFRPMDEHERGGRGLNRRHRKPSAFRIDDRKISKSRFRETPCPIRRRI